MDQERFIQEANSIKDYITRVVQEVEGKIQNLDEKLDLFVTKNNLLKYLQANENQLKSVQRRVDQLGDLDLSKIATHQSLDAVKAQVESKMKKMPDQFASVIENKTKALESEISKIASVQLTKDKLYQEVDDIKNVLRGQLQDYVSKEAYEGGLEGFRSSFSRQTGDLSKRIDSVSKNIPTDFVSKDALKSVRDEAIKLSSQADRKVELFEERMKMSVDGAVEFSSQQLEKRITKELEPVKTAIADTKVIFDEWSKVKSKVESTADITSQLQEKAQEMSDDIQTLIIQGDPSLFKSWKIQKELVDMNTESRLERLANLSEVDFDKLEDSLKKLSFFTTNVEELGKQVMETKKGHRDLVSLIDQLQGRISEYERHFLQSGRRIQDIKSALEEAGLNVNI